MSGYSNETKSHIFAYLALVAMRALHINIVVKLFTEFSEGNKSLILAVPKKVFLAANWRDRWI